VSKISSNCMHIGLRVKDYQASLRFYQQVLGFELMFELSKKDLNETIAKSGVKPPDLTLEEEKDIWLTYLRIKKEQYIELFPVPDEEVAQFEGRQSFFHISLQVDNIVKKVAELKKRGVEIYLTSFDMSRGIPAPEPFVPLRGRCGSLIAWIRDPDGNMIEIMELTDQSMQRKFDFINP